ncbi:MAG: exosome non-catalytic core subunit rrp46 [Ramalina farinacea]|uniref:Exosome non-catalytic core subunit rrp46 n=1 Tax=Ramalina farinacea TaxID=258253 RepID=A0AA43QMU0_9LECA|nr:exosome non-catalytic core subunit rrp46 [Ramalina farinacea]
MPGVRERHLESILHSTLRQVILVSAHPRTLIQITLQVVASQEDESSMMGLPQAASNIDVLPALVQTAMLALLTTSIPLVMTVTAALICIDEDGAVLSNPDAKALRLAESVHVSAFSSLGKMTLAQSEGKFSINDWEKVHDSARQICLGPDSARDLGDDVSMTSEQEESLQEKLRNAVESRVSKEQAWKTGGE